MTAATSRWFIRGAMVLLVVAAVLAWVAVGELADAEAARLANAPSADLMTLAASTAELAEQLHTTLAVLSIGVNSAGEATGQTASISENLRLILESIPDVADAEQIAGELGNIEAALFESQGGLVETYDALVAAEPVVAGLVETLNASLDEGGGSTTGGPATPSPAATDNSHSAFARAAIVAATLALLGALVVLDSLTRGWAKGTPTRSAQP